MVWQRASEEKHLSSDLVQQAVGALAGWERKGFKELQAGSRYWLKWSGEAPAQVHGKSGVWLLFFPFRTALTPITTWSYVFLNF